MKEKAAYCLTLSSKGGADSLSAGQALNYNGGTGFSISVGLTEKGLKAYEDVIVAVFFAIELLQRDGLPRWIYDEVKAIHAV